MSETTTKGLDGQAGVSPREGTKGTFPETYAQLSGIVPYTVRSITLTGLQTPGRFPNYHLGWRSYCTHHGGLRWPRRMSRTQNNRSEG